MATSVSPARSWSSVHLDAIRGVAALVVMLGHSRGLFFSSITATPTRDAMHPLPVSSAYAGIATTPAPLVKPKEPITIGNEMVIIFFVLSGYLVGGSVLNTLRRRTWAWSSYLVKRLSRLWTVLIPALIVGFALDILGLHFFGRPGSLYMGPPGQEIVSPGLGARLHWTSPLGSLIFLQAIYLPLPGTNESLWTLANEFWYYVAFPAMLLPFAKGVTLSARCTAAVVFAAVAATMGPAIGLLYPVWVAGALLSLAPRILPRRGAVIGSAALAALLLPTCVLVRKLPIPRLTAQYLIAAYTIALLWHLLQQPWMARDGLYNRVATLLSRLSYTLYAFHLPLLVFFAAIANRPWRILARTPQAMARFVGVNVATLLIVELLYRLFEAHTDQVRDALLKLLPKQIAKPAEPSVTLTA